MHYQELTVWQKSIDLVEKVYKLTKEFPKDEVFGLISQMRRAAISIPSKIAEGSRRKTLEDKQFLRISFGSASELETQIIISERLNYGNKNLRKEIQLLLVEVLKMLNKMIY